MLTFTPYWLAITPNPLRDFTVIGLALVIMLTVCFATRYIFIWLETVLGKTTKPAPELVPVALDAAPKAAPPAEDKALYVVIAAAVAATLKKPHRIITIEPFSGAWSSEGRARHHSSHNIR